MQLTRVWNVAGWDGGVQRWSSSKDHVVRIGGVPAWIKYSAGEVSIVATVVVHMHGVSGDRCHFGEVDGGVGLVSDGYDFGNDEWFGVGRIEHSRRAG